MKNNDFIAVYSNRKSVADSNMVLYKLDTELNSIRVGYSVSKKVGNSVVRHRITRRLREITKESLKNIDGSFDLVIVARNSAATADFMQLSNSFKKLFGRIDKIRNEKNTDSNN